MAENDEELKAPETGAGGDAKHAKPITFTEIIVALANEAEQIRNRQDRLVAGGFAASPDPTQLRRADVFDKAADLAADAQVKARTSPRPRSKG